MAWTETMSRMSMRDGWLIYAGRLGVITAEVLHADMHMQAHTINVTSTANPVSHVIYGSRDVTFTASLSEKLEWSKTTSQEDAPHMGALLALARRHPGEYAELREGEAILKALGG